MHTANAERRLQLERMSGAHRRLVIIGIEAERHELAMLRDQNVINDETARAITPRIDHLELYSSEEIDGRRH